MRRVLRSNPAHTSFADATREYAIRQTVGSVHANFCICTVRRRTQAGLGRGNDHDLLHSGRKCEFNRFPHSCHSATKHRYLRCRQSPTSSHLSPESESAPRVRPLVAPRFSAYPGKTRTGIHGRSPPACSHFDKTGPPPRVGAGDTAGANYELRHRSPAPAFRLDANAMSPHPDLIGHPSHHRQVCCCCPRGRSSRPDSDSATHHRIGRSRCLASRAQAGRCWSWLLPLMSFSSLYSWATMSANSGIRPKIMPAMAW